VFTRLLHLRNLKKNVLAEYADLLAPIEARDAVLSDSDTMWIIPAFRGRVVSAMHYELFVPDSPDASEAQREETLRRYGAKWTVLNPEYLSGDLFHSLQHPGAIARQSGGMALMSAAAWIGDAPRSR
jgi:hypothetical protein